MKKKRSLLILVLVVVASYVGLHFSKTSKGFSDYATIRCYDPNSADTGFYVDLEQRSDQANFGEINIAGKQVIAEYGCRKGSHDNGNDNVRVSCFDPNTVDDGYVLSFQESQALANDPRVATVDVVKLNFSGVQKVAQLPCYSGDQ